MIYIIGKTKFVPLFSPEEWEHPYAYIREAHGRIVRLSKSKGRRKEKG